MRSIKFNLSTPAATGWDAAITLTEAYLTENLKANQLLDRLPAAFTGERRAACQSLFLGALRHGHRVQHALKPFIRQKPRALIEAIFLVAGYEMLSADAAKYPQIVHHAVERSKQAAAQSETGLLNAVLRKLPEALEATHPSNKPDAHFSHPKWLFKRWNKEFGAQTTLKLMEWNQRTPATYLKLYETPGELPQGLETTQWQQFYKVSAGASWAKDLHPLLNKGNAYIKDPSTRLAPGLLAPKKGDDVLDLCAAPGGKAYDLAHLMQREGHIVALDLPGNRIQRLSENLENLATEKLQCTILEGDLLELTDDTFAGEGLPAQYDAVMLDAPCSNTGVIQRRTDVKWRLRGRDVSNCAYLQKQLLAAAASCVKPGGRLVYSTCSIEIDENREVVDAFLKSDAGARFTLKDSAISLPWETGHDGAGAFLLIAENAHTVPN
jgi:16S rRNA (cytosine967-C5)-methyltransferase